MSMAVMMACVCVGVSSCSDDDDNPATSKKVSKLELTLNAQLSDDLKEVAIINFHVQHTVGNNSQLVSGGEDLFTQTANTVTATANGVPATFQLTCSSISKKNNFTPKEKYEFSIVVKYNIKATFEDGSTTDVSLTRYKEFENKIAYGPFSPTDVDEVVKSYLSALKTQIDQEFKSTISVEMDKNGKVVGTVTQK